MDMIISFPIHVHSVKEKLRETHKPHLCACACVFTLIVNAFLERMSCFPSLIDKLRIPVFLSWAPDSILPSALPFSEGRDYGLLA